MTQHIHLIFGDFETAGLNPDVDPPFEFGCISVDHTLEVVDRRRYLFKYPEAFLDQIRLTAWDGHERTGVWDDLYQAARAQGAIESLDVIVCDPGEFDGLLCAFAHSRFTAKPHLAGFGPHFDLRYLRRYAPTFVERCISHQLRDVRTLANECRDRYNDWGPKPFGNHRAINDCEAALAYLRWYRSHVMSPYNRARPKEL